MAQRLKDLYMTPASVGDMAAAIKSHHPAFDKNKFFVLVVDDRYEDLELKARMRRVTECLRRVLPTSYAKALDVLKKAAPDIGGFESMCLPDFVGLYGLDDWDRSLDALALFTRYSSSEFAIRPFIVKDPKRAMAFLTKLAGDKNENVRRFASEGCRPRLPWAMALPLLKKDPRPILPILEKLKTDESEFVRKSVANNLNDISKDNPEVTLDIAERWYGKNPNTDWIVKHACRTLLKKGNPHAMRLFGVGDPARVTIKRFELDKSSIKIGSGVRFSFTFALSTKTASRVRLEYAVQFAKARGKVSRKVFKIAEKDYGPGEHTVTRRHSFVDMSTRKHYPGKHRIGVIVNGVEKAGKDLTLLET